MRRKVSQYIGIFVMLFVVGGLVNAKPCQAASAEVILSADSTEVTAGDNVFVYININSDTLFGDFEANLTYNEDLLEYQGGASVITGGNGYLKISDTGLLEGDTSRKYTLKFQAIKAGMCTFAFNQRAAVYDFDNGYEMSVSSNELTMNVKAPVTASNDTNLKSLKISPSVLTPTFDKGIFEYNVTVDYQTEQLIIAAIPEDDKSTVTISGNDTLVEGENKVVVSVLAESGDVIEYTINVRKEAAPTQVTITPTLAPEDIQGSFKIVTIAGEEYAVFSGKYQLQEPSSDITIPEGYTAGSIFIAGISIPAYLPINNQESEFVLLYAKNELEETGFYRYDRVEKTMLRYVPDSTLLKDQTSSQTAEDNSSNAKYNSNMKKVAIVIALMSALSGLLAFVVISLLLKMKRRK